MSIVAVWFEEKENRIWCAADTRISRGGGSVRLTDSGVKLYSLPVVCKRVGTPKPHYASTFGIAFAGSTLAATMTFASVGTITQMLESRDSALPKLSDIAQLVLRVGRKTIQSPAQHFVAVLFGFCPSEKLFKTLTVRSETQTVEETKLETNTQVVSIGAGVERLTKKIEAIRSQGDEFGRKARVAKSAIESMIQDNDLDIGGAISVGIADEMGFWIPWVISPIASGKPAARRSLNGIDLDRDVGPIGNFMIGGVGIG